MIHHQRHARPKSKIDLQAKISELQGELDLINARKNLFNTLSEFANGSGGSSTGAGGLKAQIDAIKSQYRDEIVRQTKEIQRTTASSSGGDAQATVQLNFTSSGVQALVRYPVHLLHAAEIDERVSRELLNAMPSSAA